MKLERIYIKNFRSIGEDGIEIIFNSNHTIFVGENNVGKSSVIEAIKKALSFNYIWDDEDWHLMDHRKVIKIGITFVLDDDQINKLLSLLKELKKDSIRSKLLDTIFSVEKFKNTFGNRLYFEIKNNSNKFFVTIGFIKNFVTVEDFNLKFGFMIFDNARLNPYDKVLYENLLEILREKIIFINEFREKPEENLVEVLFSSTGKDLPAVIFNIKNSREREKSLRIYVENLKEYFQISTWML